MSSLELIYRGISPGMFHQISELQRNSCGNTFINQWWQLRDLPLITMPLTQITIKDPRISSKIQWSSSDIKLRIIRRFNRMVSQLFLIMEITTQKYIYNIFYINTFYNIEKRRKKGLVLCVRCDLRKKKREKRIRWLFYYKLDVVFM
jgi:hypothetical protein